MDIDENTLYPLLRRLETQGLLDSEWREEDSGRSASTGCRGGRGVLGQLLEQWADLDAVLQRIIKEDPDMTLVDRYLRAVRDNLPRTSRTTSSTSCPTTSGRGSRTRKPRSAGR